MRNKITELVITKEQTENQTNELAAKTLPWLFGAGIAAGHLMTASNCTLPQQGKCAVCGGCVVALGSLVAWAVINKKNGNDFYSQQDDNN
jgi:hypothetical protein